MIRRHLAGIRRTLRGTTPDAEAAARVTPAPAVEPQVAEMPGQRVRGGLIRVSEAELESFVRAAACRALGRELLPYDERVLAAIVERGRAMHPDLAAKHDREVCAELDARTVWDQ